MTIGQVVLDEMEARMVENAEFLEAPEINRTGAPISTVDLVTLLEKEFGEVGAVLTGDPCDES